MTRFWKYVFTTVCFAVILGFAILWLTRKLAVEQRLSEETTALRIAAEAGDSKAQYQLGVRYYEGHGVQQDNRKSAQWYLRAAEQGYAPAESSLAFSYEHGFGVTQDYNEALRWYRMAAEKGDADAECNLGTMYRTGKGVAQDYVEAVRWYSMASGQGNRNGQYALGYMYYNGQGVSRDYTRAAELYRQASERGLASAEYDLAYMYFDGRGVPKDRDKGYLLLHRAASQGEERALRSLDLKASPFWTERRIIAFIVLFGSLTFLANSWVPNLSTRNRHNRMRMLAAAAGLLYAGMSLFPTFSHSTSDAENLAHIVSFVETVLLGVFSSLLLSIFIPKIYKTVLAISFASLIGFNVFAFRHYDLRNSNSALDAFYRANGLLVGVVISLVILSLLAGRTSRRVSLR